MSLFITCYTVTIEMVATEANGDFILCYYGLPDTQDYAYNYDYDYDKGRQKN